MLSRSFRQALWALGSLITTSQSVITSNENATHITLSNSGLDVALAKSHGRIVDVLLEGQDLLGPVSGSSGLGPYLDCSCVPTGFWTPGATSKLQLIEGVDSTDTEYAGVIMSDTHAASNLTLTQYLFMRDGETGLHAFSRLTFFNESTPRLRDLGEMRLLFRPNTPLWTHFSTSDGNYGPLPSRKAFDEATTVQDATTYLGDTPDDPYVEQYSDYFTKYSLSESWRNHDVHGQYSDGSQSVDGSTYGAWLVHNTRESYYGGPIHADLVVDGIVYNYMVSGHFGAPVPNITHGFDRTWGPQFYYFNKGQPETTLAELRADAAQFADPEWNVDFYDSIAEHVPNYIPSSRRTTFEGTVELPTGAERPIIVLSENKQDFQLNVFRQSQNSTGPRSMQKLELFASLSWRKAYTGSPFTQMESLDGTSKMTWLFQKGHAVQRDNSGSSPGKRSRRGLKCGGLVCPTNRQANTSMARNLTQASHWSPSSTGFTGASTISRTTSPLVSTFMLVRAQKLRI